MKNNRAIVEWASIEEVLPNPLNPRKNDAIKTEEMQAIIKKRGWEEPLTVYRKGKMYVVLAGHRRLFAARSAGVKQIPVFIVDSPATHQEEIERIASLQSGRVDWTAFEWARFTYERWVAWGQPNIKTFAKEINLNTGAVEAYISVLSYFPLPEIEAGLKFGGYNISVLESLVHWIRSLKKHHPQLVNDLTEEMVRKVMLDKITEKSVSRDLLRRTEFISKADSNFIKEFLLSRQMKLEEAMLKLDIDAKKKSFHGSLVSIGALKKSLVNINPKTDDQVGKAVDTLLELQKSIESKLKELERTNAKIVKEKQESLW